MLSSLIGKSVKIQRAGREWKACCPFHQEKTPSFTINDDKGFYHCFGCGAHGDAIRWMTEQRGLPFMEAVKELASSAGLDVPAPSPQAAAAAERASGLHEVMAEAAKWFADQLLGLEGAEARAYLDQRGILPDTRAKFGLGYAPESRGKLRAALKNCREEQLIEAGLLGRSDQDSSSYDRFRRRLMIPIKDQRGRVIAFGGRVIGQGEPKYLNSPETPLFDKGRTLYNIDQALPASRSSRRIIVVEGYLDVVALSQAQFDDTVAPLGTALTEAQMERLWRVVDSPTICFDGDCAGQRAAARAARRALSILPPGKSLVFAPMPSGQDPDDVVRESGSQSFGDIVAKPRPMARVLYSDEQRLNDLTTPEQRAGFRQRLEELAATCGDRFVKEQYQQAFREQFYEDYGWKRQWRGTVQAAILSTGPFGNVNLLRMFARSALYGLSMFPTVVAANIEAVGTLPLKHDELLRWRDGIVEAVFKRPTLDTNVVTSILEVDAPPPKQVRALMFDTRFAYAKTAEFEAEMPSRLTALVNHLNDEPLLDDQLASFDARVAAAATDDEWEAVEAERRTIRVAKRDLLDRGYDHGAPATKV
ncbi:MAG: DNA primase [Burkholderiales bacterium]|nr:DNA primase [Burkholderiales bacterium]